MGKRVRLSASGVGDEDVLKDILPAMTWHDYRGWPSEDTWWLRGYFVSNKYLWIVDVERYYSSEIHDFDYKVIISKYDFGILTELTDPLILKRLLQVELEDDLKKIVLDALP